MNKFPIRGVIEGFYGRPWNHKDRLNMIEFLGNLKMNTYVYAPKDDPYHRQEWRTPYPSEHTKNFSSLLEAGAKHNVSLIWALSPGLSMIYSSATDYSLLQNKYKAMKSMGFTNFGLFFDDIPLQLVHQEDRKTFNSLAEAQAIVANNIYMSLKEDANDIHLFFCPTEYMGIGNSEYLQILGDKLHPEIEVFWTGPQVCSEKLDLNNAKTVATSLNRQIIFWDNYPVNDASMQPELHIGPYINRDHSLLHYSKGILLNPMDLVESSKIALYAASKFLNTPDTYEPESSWIEAIENLVGPKLAPSFIRFARANSISCLEPAEPRYLQVALKSFEDSLAVMDWAGALIDASIFFKQLESDLPFLYDLPSSLLEEIKPWLDEYKAWISIALNALTILIEFRDLNQAGAGLKVKETREAVRKGLINAVDFKTSCCGDVIRNFAQKVYRSTSYFLANTPWS